MNYAGLTVPDLGEPPRERSPRESTDIPPTKIEIPTTVAEIRGSSGSWAGYSGVSTWLSCPEKSRLRALGVQMTQRSNALGKMDYGTLMHALLALRVAYGHDVALQVLHQLDLEPEDRDKAWLMLGTYENTYPLPDPWTYLGIESEITTDIGDGRGGSCLRSVRYDALIWVSGPYRAGLYALERKTSASSGANVMLPYLPQLATQQALWNLNPHLVRKYGPMLGVIPELLVKTKVPKAERLGPHESSPFMLARIVEYLRLGDTVQYAAALDGGNPRYFHSCYARFSACEYIPLCWEGMAGLYTTREERAAQVISEEDA